MKILLFGESHAENLDVLQHIVTAEVELKMGVSAILHAANALSICQTINGEIHPSTARCYIVMAKALELQSRSEEAKKFLQKAALIQSNFS